MNALSAAEVVTKNVSLIKTLDVVAKRKNVGKHSKKRSLLGRSPEQISPAQNEKSRLKKRPLKSLSVEEKQRLVIQMKQKNEEMKKHVMDLLNELRKQKDMERELEAALRQSQERRLLMTYQYEIRSLE